MDNLEFQGGGVVLIDRGWARKEQVVLIKSSQFWLIYDIG